jgi:hypothetical protein
MANTVLTPAIIAKQALATLYAQTVMLPLVHRDYENEYQRVGDTITVRKPATFVARDFVADGNAIQIQNASEGSVAVVMNKHLDVSFEVTSKELTLTLADFNSQLLAPALMAIAQGVDQLLFGLYVDIYNTTGTAGVTPSTVADVTAPRRVLQVNKVPPTERRLVFDPFAEEKMLQIEAFTNTQWNPVSNAEALNEAALGRKYGFDIFGGQNVKLHDNGTIAHTGTFATVGSSNAGTSSVTINGTTVTGTWKAGSLFTVAFGAPSVTYTYLLTADATAAANSITVAVAPTIPVTIPGSTTVVRLSNHTANLAFHRTAFAFVTRPLAMPLGNQNAHIENFGGLGLRVVYDYNSTNKKDVVSIDLLCGVKTLDPVRAVRVLG